MKGYTTNIEKISLENENFRNGVVHQTKADAVADEEEHFDSITTEQ